MKICIYCKKPNTEPSREHVIADALGGCIELPAEDVCRTCNGSFDQQIDRAVQNDLRPILAQLTVPGKRGTPTRWTATENIDSENRRFNVGPDEVVAAEPRKLLLKIGNTWTFRGSREELERARADLAAKNPGKQVVLSDLEESVPDLPPDRVDDIDFSRAHWNRWAAKTCLNAIGYVLGRDVALLREFDDLRELALSDGTCPAELHHGGIGHDVSEIDDLHAEHRIEIRVEQDRIDVRIALFDFCGLRFSRSVRGLADSERTIVLDATEKRVKTNPP